MSLGARKVDANNHRLLAYLWAVALMTVLVPARAQDTAAPRPATVMAESSQPLTANGVPEAKQGEETHGRKLAIGAAAAIAAGLVASELSKDDEEKPGEASSGSAATEASASPNPSFDCAKASHEVEELICKDAELADLDRSLSDLYSVVLKNTPASEQKMLKAEQRGWVKGRNDCWKSSDERGCVKREYEARISDLKDR